MGILPESNSNWEMTREAQKFKIIFKTNLVTVRTDQSKVMESSYSTPMPPGRSFLVSDHGVVRTLSTFVFYLVFNKISTIVILFVQQSRFYQK